MSNTPATCPAPAALEAIALGHPVEAGVAEHLAACPQCQARLERIRADNALLGSFAVAGALPVDSSGAEPRAIDIPGYEILREIHRGGQGVVYQARQHSTHRDVAIKVMRQGPFATLSDRGRFEREVETLAKIDHPNIVAVHDAGVVSGFHYVVMDYIDGQALDEWAAEQRRGAGAQHAGAARARVHETLHLFIRICDAVHAAHLRGVMHRDLKPGNIRVDRDGVPHVLDFGLAKSTDDPGDSAMTRTGQFVGSLPWASPEQVEGAPGRVDLRTDVYSLGAMLYQLLTGVLPFDVGSNLREALNNILAREPVRPSAAAASGLPRCDDELDTIVLKCLAKERGRRYQSAGELARDLRRYLSGEPIEAKRDSALYVVRKMLRRYRLHAAAAGGFVLLITILAVVMTLLYGRSARLEREAVQSAESMRRLLSQSNIEQGRMAGVHGNLDQAENLLWRELLTRSGGTNDPVRLTEPPGPAEAHWALWELYRARPCLRTLPLPSAPMTVTVARDGKRIWTADAEGGVLELDRFGRTLSAVQLGTGPSSWPTICGNGRYVLSSNALGVTLRRLGDKQPVLELHHDPGPAVYACVSNDAELLATIVDNQAVVYHVQSGAVLRRFGEPGRPIGAIALSHDKTRLATRGLDGALRVWDIATGRETLRLPSIGAPRNALPLCDLLFTPDDRRLIDVWLAIAGRIVDLDHQPPRITELSEAAGTYRTSAVSPDGRLLAIGDFEGAVRLFDIDTGQRLANFVAHPRVYGIAFARDGAEMWTCGGQSLRLWRLTQSADVRVERIEGERNLHDVAVAADGSWLAAVGGADELHVRRSDESGWRSCAFGNDSIVSTVTIAPDGRSVAAGTYGHVVCLWSGEARTGLDDPRGEAAPPSMRLPHPEKISCVRFSPDGSHLATACDDGNLRLWRMGETAPEQVFSCGGDRMPQVAFDDAGARLAVAVRDGSLWVWDLASRTSTVLLPPSLLPMRAVRFAHHRNELLSAGADRTVRIWDGDKHQQIGALVGHSQEIYCLDVSRDDTLVASGDAGGSIRLWDLPGQRPLATLTGHTAAVMAVRFEPDGRLVSASLDGTVREWDLHYYDRHIAGQVHNQLLRINANEIDPVRAAAWRAWADRRINP